MQTLYGIEIIEIDIEIIENTQKRATKLIMSGTARAMRRHGRLRP